MTEMLTKRLALRSAELKAEGGDARVFSGYASRFGGVDAYGDTIVKGAYQDTLRDRDRPVLLRWNHVGPVVGRFTEMKEDDVGLFVRGELTPGHSTADDVYASLKHGAVSGLSIGYRVPPGGAEERNGIRYLKRIDLVEISIVESPADLGANVEDVKTDVTSAKSMEKALRDIGLSKRQAKRFMARGFEGLAMSDAEEEAKEIADALERLNAALSN